MRNVGSLGPWLWRPSLQKNVAGLELRLGAHPPPGGGVGRTAQVSKDLAGWGLRWLQASLQRCSHGEFPRRAQPVPPPPSDLEPGVDSLAWADNLFLLLFGGGGERGRSTKIYLLFSKLKNKLLFRGTWLHPHSSRLALQR